MPGVKTTKPVTFMAKKSPADLLKEGQELQAKAKQLIKDAQLKLKGEARKAHTKRLIILGAWIEPARVSWRPVGLSQAAMATCSARCR